MLGVNRLYKQDSHETSSNSRIAQIASAIAMILALLVLIGWSLNLEFLKSVFASSALSMKASTAACLALSGLSLWLTQTKQVDQRSGIFSFSNRQIARICAITVQVIGLVTLSQYLFGWNFEIPDLLFRNHEIPITPYYPGRMGLNTGLNFMLIGRALELVIKPKSERSYWFAQTLALLACVISGLAVMG